MSIQERDVAVDEFIARYGLDYRFLMDRTGEVSSTYQVTSTPTTFFISPEGVIVDSTTGVVSQAWIEEHLEPYLAA